MPHQTITTLAGYTSGSHRGPACYAEWLIIIAAVIGLPIYLVRYLRARRNRR